MITNRAVNEAIDYIFCHVEEDIGLEDVAEHCHFSKFYFSRLFKEQTGESVYGFIKRVRLEQSAFRLKVERDRRITEISADYGYSSSNFSSAFKLHYDVIASGCDIHPMTPLENIQAFFDAVEEYYSF